MNFPTLNDANLREIKVVSLTPKVKIDYTIDVTYHRGTMTYCVPVFVHVEADKIEAQDVADFENANIVNAKVTALNSIIHTMCQWH